MQKERQQERMPETNHGKNQARQTDREHARTNTKERSTEWPSSRSTGDFLDVTLAQEVYGVLRAG